MFDTLLRMRIFVAVYEERSFTAAADRENATQSGVTQHIRKLEEQFGARLFDRGGARVVPTAAGDTYYHGCIEVLRAHEQTRNSMKAAGSQLSGEVIIGLTPTMTRGALAPALKRVKALHPLVVVRVIDAYSDIILEKLRAREIDIGVVPGFRQETGIRSRPFARTPEFLVTGPASGLDLRHRARVRLADLGPLKMVLPSGLQPRRQYLETYLAASGASVVDRIEIDSSLGADDFIAQTDWVCCHPGISMMREYEDGRLIVNPLVDPPLMLDLFRIERARDPMAPAVAAFMEILQAETAKLQKRAMRLVEQ